MNTDGKGTASWEIAYEEVKKLILSREIFPGEIVTESGISRRLGMSRTPVREAFKRLQQEGLLHESNRRKRVSALDTREIEQIFDLKEMVEGGISRWAAERASEKDLGVLKRMVAEMDEMLNHKPDGLDGSPEWKERWHDWDNRFHTLLIRMAGNPRAAHIVTTLDAPWYKVRLGIETFTEWIEKSKAEHQMIAEAILRRDAEQAEQVTRAHIRNLKRMLIGLMNVFSLTTRP